MKNDENACVTMPTGNSGKESIYDALRGATCNLDNAIDTGLKIMRFVGEKTDNAQNVEADDMFAEAICNRDKAAIVARMMEYIAETLGC